MTKKHCTYPINWLRGALLLVFALAMAACESDSASHSSFNLPVPQKIRQVSQINQDAVGAELLTTAGTTLLTRDGDVFTGSIVVQPGVEFSYTINIFELVDGDRLALATQDGSVTVNEDTAIEVGDAYQFPDRDNDGFSNLDERIAQSDPSNSFSTPDNIDGTPTMAGLAQFAQSQFSVTEDSGTLAIQVLRLAGSTGAVTARYELSDETATADVDYRAATGQLNWADGDTAPRTIFVNVFSDDDSEGTETFLVSLFSVSGGLAIGNGTARISIEDSTPPPEPGTVQFAVSSVTASEADGSVEITVERIGGSDNEVSVQYAFSDGSATNNADYTGVGGTLNWGDGDSSARTIVVPIATDDDDEATETFSITLSAPTGGAVIDADTVTVSIEDSTPTPEPGQLLLSASSYSFTEGTTGAITVQRTNGADGAQTVDYFFTAGTATAGVDFSAADGQLSWADGDQSARQIDITINSDDIVEPAETLTIQLVNPVGGASVPTTSASITLNDATPTPVPGNVQLTAPSFTVAEGASVEISVERLNGQDGAISIDYAVTAGSATLNADFSDTNGTLTWADGDTGNRTFIVTALNDDTIEADETFNVVLSNPSGGTSTLRSTAMVTITDSTPDPEPGTIAFAAQSGAIDEGQTRGIIVQRSNGSDGAVTIQYQTQPDSADGSDFVATSGTLSWADGDTSDRTIDVTASADALVESSESFTLQLSNPGGGAALGQSTLTLTITDTTVPPQPGLLEFVASDGLVSEGGTITLEVARRNGSDGAVSVVWSSADGSATAPADYSGGSATLQWADGDTGNRSIQIPTQQDALVEGDENLTVSLTSAGGGATLGLASLTVTIVDTTVAPVPGTLAFVAEQSSVTEGASSGIEVSRSGGSDGPVSVDYSISSGTASSADHNITSGTLTWTDADNGNRSIAVTAATDALTEGPETVVLTLSNATNGSSIGTSTHTLTIVDDPPDPVPGTLGFASASSSVTEGGSTDITVSRSGGSDGQVSITYSITGGSADTSDHNIVNGTLTWPAGDNTDRAIPVAAATDAATEGDETVELTLTNATGDASIGASSHTLTIVDDPPDPDPVPGTLAFASTSGDVTEGASTSIAVSRTGGSDGEVSIDFAVSGGSADSSDHTINSGTLTWSNGDTADKTILANAQTDADTEGDETVVITLSDPGGGATLGDDTFTLTIIDDAPDPVPGELAFGEATYTVAEGAQVSIEVVRSGGSDGPVSVDYDITGGNADTDDHDISSDTLNWADGDTSTRTILVNAATDASVEGDETVILTLSNAGGGASIGQATTTLTITDGTTMSFGTLTVVDTLVEVDEGETAAMSVARTDGSDGPVSVSFSVSGTATNGDDFTIDGQLDWADGDTDDKTINLTAIADGEPEPPTETVIVTLTAPTGGATIDTDTGMFNIIDVQAGQLQFSVATATVAEGAALDVSVERTNGSDGEITVTYTVIDQTATAGVDHDAVSGTLTFANGSADAQTITINALTDLDTEGDETLQITLSNVLGGATLGQASIDINITDVPPAAKLASVSDALWPVCFESTDLYGTSAWAMQPDLTSGLNSACVKRCGELSTATTPAGWGYDLGGDHACVYTDAQPGTLSEVPVYNPGRVAFAESIEREQLLPDTSPWQCQLQSRASGEARFNAADDILHELDFRSDGSYHYLATGSAQPDQPLIDELGVWATDDRSLKLDHLAVLHRNVHFESASAMALYITDTTRYSCRH